MRRNSLLSRNLPSGEPAGRVSLTESSRHMSTDCLAKRSEPLISAASRERHDALAGRLLEISGEMNRRGIIHSSIYVNAVADACAAQLHELASIAWSSVQRAHESCGRGDAEAVFPYFARVLELESDKLDAALQGAISTAAAGLQNKSMLRVQAVRDAHDHLVQKYCGEIEIYVANLTLAANRTLLDRWKNGLKNNRLVAVLSLVVAGVVVVAGFTDALGKLDSFVRKVLLGES